MHAGLDYVGAPGRFGQRLTAGLDVKWLEPADWHSAVSATVGIKLERQSLERRGVTLLLEAYEGFPTFRRRG